MVFGSKVFHDKRLRVNLTYDYFLKKLQIISPGPLSVNCETVPSLFTLNLAGQL